MSRSPASYERLAGSLIGLLAVLLTACDSTDAPGSRKADGGATDGGPADGATDADASTNASCPPRPGCACPPTTPESGQACNSCVAICSYDDCASTYYSAKCVDGLWEVHGVPDIPWCPQPEGGTSTCTDFEQSPGESDVDCGGPCEPCRVGAACAASTDCSSGQCVNAKCQASSTCSDGVRGGLETDVDCGGKDCPPCAECSACTVNLDCQPGGDCISVTCKGGQCISKPKNFRSACSIGLCDEEGQCRACHPGTQRCSDGVAQKCSADAEWTDQPGCSGCAATELIGIGYVHACAVRADGTFWCWGDNTHGQLGIGSTANQGKPPTQVVGLDAGVAQIAAGNAHSCVRLASGEVYCWGDDQLGQVGDASATSESCFFGDCASAPRKILWPNGAAGAVTDLSANLNRTCAVRNGSIWCWGDGVHSPEEVVGVSLAIAIALGEVHACALTATGSVWCWGKNDKGQLGHGPGPDAAPSPVPGLDNAVEVTAGSNHTCVRRNDGSIQCWGWNADGQLGDGTNVDRAQPVDTVGPANPKNVVGGRGSTCSIDSDDALWCWGDLAGSSTPILFAPVAGAITGVDLAQQVGAGREVYCLVDAKHELWCAGQGALTTGRNHIEWSTGPWNVLVGKCP